MSDGSSLADECRSVAEKATELRRAIDAGKGPNSMFSGRASKPLVSALLALLLVLAFVLPFLQLDFLAGPATPWDIVQAGSIRWAVILTVGLVWLGVQLFWKASTSA